MDNFKVPTLSEAWDAYIANKTNLKKSTLKAYASEKKYLSEFHDKRLDEIKQREIVDWYDTLAAACGHSLAHKIQREGKAVVNWAITYYSLDLPRPFMERNPFQALRHLNKLKPLKRRETIISKDQWPKWLRAVLNMKYAAGRDCVLFMWMTGCRVGESRNLQWQDIDLEFGFMNLPAHKTKTGKSLKLPLSQFLIKMLAARRPDNYNLAGYVFEGTNPNRLICDNHRGYNSVCKKIGVAHKFHDIRRSYITVLAEDLQVPLLIIKRLVNHSSLSDVTDGYYVSDPESLRPMVEKISRRLLQLAQMNTEASPFSICSNYQPASQIPDGRTSLVSVGGVSITVSESSMN